MGVDRDPNSLHKYVYVKNDPVHLVDPSGNVFAVGGGFGSLSGMTLSTVLRTSGSSIAGVAARNSTTRFLFGYPPKSFGMVGELVLDHAMNAIMAQAGIVFPNKGAFGTAAHLKLENSIKGYSPYPGVTIDAEVFYLEPEDGKRKIAKKKREKGSLGLDIVVNYKGEQVLGLDLKTGAGFPKKKVNKIFRRSGLDIVEIKVKFGSK